MEFSMPSIQSILNTVLILAGFGVTLYFLWKTKAVSVYKDSVDAYEVRLGQVLEELKTIKIENKELHAQVNQLIGENKTLSSVVAKPDDSFKETVQVILTEIKNLREDFVKHAEQDDKRFENIGKYVKDNHDILKGLKKEVL